MPEPAAPSNVTSRLRLALRCAVAAGALAACLLLSACGTAVPDLTGMTVSEASSALAQSGFVVGKVDYEQRFTAMTGVISQSPAAKEQAKPGAVVDLIVAGQPPRTGPAVLAWTVPQPVAVPYLVGLRREQALSVLDTMGLRVGAVSGQRSETAPTDEVLGQTPTPGAWLPRGSAVGIVVSAGPSRVAVPSVVGLVESKAKTRLQSAGLTVGIRRAYSSAKKGVVREQSPSRGSVEPGARVLLTISRGPRPVVKKEPAPAPAPVFVLHPLKGVLVLWAANSAGEPDSRTGYAFIHVLGGGEVRARCPYRSAGEGDSVWVARRASGSWIVTGLR